MVNESSDKEYEHPSTSELPENKLRQNFRLGDMTWVKHSGSSWWPAQVIDEACVGSKPKKTTNHDCLVRLYGTCQYLYVDPWKSSTEFKMMLKEENKNALEVFREVLDKELSRVKSSNDYDDDDDNSEGTQTKVTTEKTSSRKVRKQEGYNGVKKAASSDNLEDESEDQGQGIRRTATTGATVQKGKRICGRKSSSSHDTTQTIDKGSCDDSAESLRGKRHKQAAHALDKEGCNKGTSMVRREGLKRSARAIVKEYLDADEDRRATLNDTGASEDAAEEDSMVHETSAPHTEIKAMVRDLLFKEIIEREHDAEMAYVDEVINGICSSVAGSMTGDATASMKGGQDIKQNGIGVEGESSREGKTDEAAKSGNPLKEVTHTTPNRKAAIKEPEQLSQRRIRQIQIMQSLGLMAPTGSPFGKIGMVAATRR